MRSKNGLKPKVKSGMLYSKRIVQAVIEGLHGCASARYVMDPVMVATSGALTQARLCRSLRCAP